MRSFPQPGSVTVCEINRNLITALNLSDDGAKDAYGKQLGMVFSPVPFQCDQLLAVSPEHGEEQPPQATSEDVAPRGKGISAALQRIVNDCLKQSFHPNDVNCLPEVDLQGVSWHQHKHILAFISGPNQVAVRDFENSEGKEPCILIYESQRDVKLLEWRPNGGKTLSVACKGGICLWAASYPGNAATARSGIAPLFGTVARGSGIRWTVVDFLRSKNDEQISALSWSPNGRYLASASYESSSFTIWDVAKGLGTPIRRGLGGISILKWSPTGDFFFSAKFDGTFYLWETNTWTSEPWSSSSGFVTIPLAYFSNFHGKKMLMMKDSRLLFGHGGFLSSEGATWDPDGHMVLIAFSKSSTLGSVHFASKPPSLDAHLLPVDFPEITSLTGSQGIEKMAWDGTGERLALSYKDGDELYKGLIAVYDVRRNPLISVSLIGFIRGPGENPKPLAFSFHDKFKQGPLLSVCWSSGFCCTYPLIFRSHVLS